MGLDLVEASTENLVNAVKKWDSCSPSLRPLLDHTGLGSLVLIQIHRLVNVILYLPVNGPTEYPNRTERIISK